MDPTLRSLLQINKMDQQQSKTFDKERQEKPLPKTVLRAAETEPPKKPPKESG